jgi:hypothetical protein
LCQWQFKRQKRIENNSGIVGVRLLNLSIELKVGSP